MSKLVCARAMVVLMIGLLIPPWTASAQSIYDLMKENEQEAALQSRPRPKLQDLPGAQRALQPPLRPKPGYIIGRIIDPLGRPMDAGVIIHIQGFPVGRQGPVEWAKDVAPAINPKNGYYEIPVEDGDWRVSAKASPELQATFPATHECLMMWQDFLPPNVDAYLQIPYQTARRGIVQDLIWNPTPWSAWKCSQAAKAAGR